MRRTIFTDPLAAIDEAQFLADQTRQPHGLYNTAAGIVVRPMNRALRDLLEAVSPAITIGTLPKAQRHD